MSYTGGDFNGHVESKASSFGEVPNGYEIGQLNDGDVWLINWAVGKGLT